jgi:predicted nucleic acid-binding protein
VKSRQRSAPRWLRQRFDELLLTDEIVMCDVVKLELLHHEDRPARFRARRADLDALPSVAVDVRTFARALEVQEALAERGGGRHRGVKLPDYLIAAAAELSGLTVLHYDADYELVASVTRQSQEWIAPRGSL